MNILETAASLFIRQLGSADGGGLNPQSVVAALQKLLPTSGGELDLSRLVGMFSAQGGLAAIASSWLGDGNNQSISASQILAVLGNDKVANFAAQLGLDTGKASEGLAGIVPDLIDKNSKGGALLGNLAGSVLGKLF